MREKLFIVEGDKNVSEVLKSSLEVEQLFATADYINLNNSILLNAKSVIKTSKDEINKASLLKNPQNSMALCKIPDERPFPAELNDLAVYLDGIQDPGNLGTIIRVCDWFGINHLFCSYDTVDVYNPKVIQAAMGSFSRVQIQQAIFNELLLLAKNSAMQIFGTYLSGENIYKAVLPEKALLVMGNEGNGIRSEMEHFIDKKVSIPQFSAGAESLNVAIATAIFCSEFKRRV